jgi:hypothetical protein
MMRRLLPHWSKVLFPGFRPWAFDNGHLIRQYRGHMDEGGNYAVAAE